MGSSASKEATILIDLIRRLRVRKVTTRSHLTNSEKMTWQVSPQIDGLRWNSERKESHRLVLPNKVGALFQNILAKVSLTYQHKYQMN